MLAAGGLLYYLYWHKPKAKTKEQQHMDTIDDILSGKTPAHQPKVSAHIKTEAQTRFDVNP
eukprot:SAG22_NODE_747_length_7495_cov_7.582342_5_plen_61_part_00